MYGESFFIQGIVYLAAAVISVPIAKRLGLGSVLGYLIAGVVIGPYLLDLVGEEGQSVMHFAEFGVVMMLFIIGLELQPALLWKMRAPILGLGGSQVLITTIVLAGAGVALGYPWQSSVAIGMVLALSSTAMVLQTLQEKGLMKTAAGEASFSVLLFQDIAVIPMLAILPLLAIGGGAGELLGHGAEDLVGQGVEDLAGHGVEGGGHGAVESGHGSEGDSTWVGGLPPGLRTLVVLGAVVIVVVVGHYLVRPAFRLIARTRLREIFVAAALLLVIGIALLMSKVGLSPALGTFLAGVVLATSEYRHELESDLEPFKGLLLGVFFISVGASVDFDLIAAEPGRIASYVVGLMALKFAVLFILGRVARLGLDQNMHFAFALAQGGEFAFVLFSFATQNRVMDSQTAAPLIATVAISMGLTPLLMLFYEKILAPRVGTKERPDQEREPDAVEEHNPVILAGFGDFGSTVGRLLFAKGVGTTVLDADPDHVDVLRKLGFRVYYGDASRLDLLRAAGADKARLMILAVNDFEATRQMIRTAKEHFPHLTLLAQARHRYHAYELLEAGVDHVFRSNLDSSLRMGVEALRQLGFRSHQAVRAARKFRRHDEEALEELAAMRHDRKAYLSRAREMIAELETSLLSDLKDTDQGLDLAWDAETLRREFGEAAERSDG